MPHRMAPWAAGFALAASLAVAALAGAEPAPDRCGFDNCEVNDAAASTTNVGPMVASFVNAPPLAQLSSQNDNESFRQPRRMRVSFRLIALVVFVVVPAAYRWFRNNSRSVRKVERSVQDRYERVHETDEWKPEQDFFAGGAGEDSAFFDMKSGQHAAQVTGPGGSRAPGGSAGPFGPISGPMDPLTGPMGPMTGPMGSTNQAVGPMMAVGMAAGAGSEQGPFTPPAGAGSPPGEQGPWTPPAEAAQPSSPQESAGEQGPWTSPEALSEPAPAAPQPGVGEQGPWTSPADMQAPAPTPHNEAWETSPLGQPVEEDPFFTLNGESFPLGSSPD